MKNIFVFFLIALSVLLSGCATNAIPQKMAATNLPTNQPKNKLLLHSITVDQVTGGHETNPLWVSKVNNDGFKQALETSLQSANLYSMSKNEAKYKLDVVLGELKQPFFGANFTVFCQAHYLLMDLKTQQKIYDKNITSDYTAKYSDNIIGSMRLQLANEGAARKNIENFIFDLYGT